MSDIHEYITLNELGVMVTCDMAEPELFSWDQLIKNTAELCNSEFGDENELEKIGIRLTGLIEQLKDEI